MAEGNYWVRTEQGRTWGPFTLQALERLRGQLTEKSEASVDGQTWRPGTDFPELRDLLVKARVPTPREVQKAPIATPVPPPPPPAPAQPEAAPEVPESGDLDRLSPVRLYALAAHTSSSGWLVLELDKGMLTVSFRRGTPEHLSSSDPELSVVRFLLERNAVTPEKALAAEEQATRTGQDVVSVLFQQQLIPAADAHRLLGEYARFLLDRALLSWRGKFSFEKDAPAPPGSFPLGSRWALLAESVRRLEVTLLRARLGKRLLRPVVRSGGLGIGKVEELALNAQESRLYAAIDGTRTGEELLAAQDPAIAVRLLYLLAELGHLSFAELPEEVRPEPQPAKPAEPAPSTPPQRELPRLAREVGRAPPGTPRPQVARAAPPVMKPSAPPRVAAPQIARPAPTFAQGPAGESAAAALQRFTALLAKLQGADHFEALGIERGSATSAEAKRNFFVLARELHPDTVTDAAEGELRQVKERLFARINEAAQVLTDDKRRKEYEDELEGKKNSVDVARIFAAEEDFQRAGIMIKARKYHEGLELLEKAIALNDNEAEFYAWRGYARFLVAQDRKAAYEECSDDCRKAIEMVERCLPGHLFLGHMAKVVGDLKLAERCYQKVLELEPKHIEAMRELRLMGKKT